MFNRLLLLSLLVVLNSCGFQLRGVTELPAQLQLLQVAKSDDSDFNAELMRQLERSKVTVVTDETAAFLSVQLQTLPEITLAKSSSSGLQIKQLKIRIEYSIKNADGEWLVKQKQLNQIRDFESNSDELLAKNNEKQQLYRQMKQNIVRILIYQLQRLK